MKVKRHKHAKRVLSFYKQNFGLREPYQVIVDGTFCTAALQGKIQIKEQLPKYLGGCVQLVTTSCVVAELGTLQLVGATFVARRFQQRRCGHTRQSIPAAECILTLIGEGNPHHYCVASQDSELRDKLSRIPGVPVLHIVRNTMVLENPSDASEAKSKELDVVKVKPSEYEQSVIDALNKATTREGGGGGGGGGGGRKKRKKRKNPNPLSVKKSHRLVTTDREAPAGVNTRSKRRRERLQRRKAMERLLLAKVVQSSTGQRPDDKPT